MNSPLSADWSLGPDCPVNLSEADRANPPGGVTIIIPNLNGRQHLPRCLRSLKQTSGVEFEILVVDNGSSDGGPEWVRENHPDVRVIALGENRGFSGALMTGVRRSSRPLVCFLNNDTEVQPDWLIQLVRTLESDKSIGAVSATLVYMHDPGMVNFGGGGMTWPGYGYQDRLGWPLISLQDRPEVEDTLFPSGAAMLIDRRLLLDCGGLDEELFPIYHEDVDLGWRLWVMGYRVVITRKSVVLHYEGGNTGPRPGAARIAMLGFRHSIRCSIKNYEPRNAFSAVAALLVSQFLSRTAGPGPSSPEGKGTSISVLIRLPFALPHLAAKFYATGKMITAALLWNLVRLGDTLRQRRFIQSKRKRRDRELLERGLIHRRPWFPFQSGHPSDWRVTFDRLFLQSELFPAEDSAIGRLAEGWGPIFSQQGRLGRTLMYLARCRLRVTPATAGCLEIRVGLTDPSNRAQVRAVCNGNVSEWTKVENLGPVTIKCEAESDARGELSVDLIVDTSGYSRRRPTWWCVVYKIGFIRKEPRPAVEQNSRVDVSVIIPTFNRLAYLQDCLSALTRQTSPPREVIVVDDGSTDGTSEFLAGYAEAGSLPFHLKTAVQANSGPAAARNRGLEMAVGNLIAFLGDDMMAGPDWLQNHIAIQQARNLSCAICGFTDWERSQGPVSPLLEFVNLHGHQFEFGNFQPGQASPFSSFYTSNLSVPAFFLRNDRFDERFRKAAFEDFQLGYRLCARGMRVVYEPRCIVHHRHPMTAADFCRRQQMVGELLVWIIERWPELKTYLLFPDPNRFYPARLGEILIQASDPILREIDRRQIKLPDSLYRLWLHTHLMIGVRSGADKI